MITDPNTLMEAARCFRCIPRGLANSVIIHLLEEWANNPTGPQVFWEPPSAVSAWIDGSGPHVGDLPTFLASADLPTVGSIQLIGVGLTTIGNLNLLPNLTNLEVNGNAGLTELDLTGCAALSTVFCQNCGLTSLTLDGCITVTTLNCSNNQIASLDVSDCTVMDNLNCSSNLITSLDCTGLAVMSVINCSFNLALSTLTLTGCVNLNSVVCNNCALTSLVIVSLGMDTLNCSHCSITDLRIGNSTIYSSVDAHDNSLPASPGGPAEGVDDVLSLLAANCLFNGGTIDLSGGTNAAPDAGPPDGAASKASLIAPGGWTVSTN